MSKRIFALISAGYWAATPVLAQSDEELQDLVEESEQEEEELQRIPGADLPGMGDDLVSGKLRLPSGEEVEKLRESTDWIKTAARLTVLQAEWKKIGPAERKAQKALWVRFSSACNEFFERRKADLGARKRQWAENLKLKDALCVQAEKLRTRDDLGNTFKQFKVKFRH